MFIRNLFVFILWFNVSTLNCDNGKTGNEHIKESPLNFDIDLKKKSPLPTCEFSYEYNLAKAIISAICFVIGAFILVFGKT